MGNNCFVKHESSRILIFQYIEMVIYKWLIISIKLIRSYLFWRKENGIGERQKSDQRATKERLWS